MMICSGKRYGKSGANLGGKDVCLTELHPLLGVSWMIGKYLR